MISKCNQVAITCNHSTCFETFITSSTSKNNECIHVILRLIDADLVAGKTCFSDLSFITGTYLACSCLCHFVSSGCVCRVTSLVRRQERVLRRIVCRTIRTGASSAQLHRDSQRDILGDSGGRQGYFLWCGIFLIWYLIPLSKGKSDFLSSLCYEMEFEHNSKSYISFFFFTQIEFKWTP